MRKRRNALKSLAKSRQAPQSLPDELKEQISWAKCLHYNECIPFDSLFTNLTRASSTRFCHPFPLARKCSTTSEDRRIVMRCFVGAF
jgi:hypothetical protein